MLALNAVGPGVHRRHRGRARRPARRATPLDLEAPSPSRWRHVAACSGRPGARSALDRVRPRAQPAGLAPSTTQHAAGGQRGGGRGRPARAATQGQAVDAARQDQRRRGRRRAAPQVVERLVGPDVVAAGHAPDRQVAPRLDAVGVDAGADQGGRPGRRRRPRVQHPAGDAGEAVERPGRPARPGRRDGSSRSSSSRRGGWRRGWRPPGRRPGRRGGAGPARDGAKRAHLLGEVAQVPGHGLAQAPLDRPTPGHVRGGGHVDVDEAGPLGPLEHRRRGRRPRPRPARSGRTRRRARARSRRGMLARRPGAGGPPRRSRPPPGGGRRPAASGRRASSAVIGRDLLGRRRRRPTVTCTGSASTRRPGPGSSPGSASRCSRQSYTTPSSWLWMPT